ncbi:carbon-nitrogen hydrolase family protein [Amaricoccus solimangrovi]|uniref:Carbon-nitrogen hydrolase family protein n=1 Tax=Amaricoccus solimangrovi TaxID=2589815 RepID=A0A501WVS7_9RHOB|nr:carbon-nitrogen hydrolase family protein [Amaricoccus solimangrovi]TPE52234.1 carbon-nitrogen hydrolase family protein [Amaricoccus solimangrovi]
MRVALVQLCSSDDPAANLATTEGLVRQAADGGATLVVTPEVTNIVSSSRARQNAMLRHEEDDPTLARLRDIAAERGIWLVIGSLAILTHDADGRFANRSFLIAPDGAIAARYDKIHMFDVALGKGESYRESAAFRPGTGAVVADLPGARLGLSICYDMRFAALYRALGQAGADIITVPAAFTVPTGRAHWHVLLRARAIETGCFILAAAQSGHHAVTEGPDRRTYGHSLIVGPWGEILAEAPDGPGVIFANLDLTEVRKVRDMVPQLRHDRSFERPAVQAPAEPATS